MTLTNPLDRMPLLRNVPLFRGLTRTALLEVAQRSTEVTYLAGATVVHQGEPGDCLCVIAKGTVEIRRDDRVLARKASGEYFGEISLIDGKPRTASVVAADDVTVLKLKSSDFDALLNIPHVARAALKGLTALLREIQEASEAQHF